MEVEIIVSSTYRNHEKIVSSIKTIAACQKYFDLMIHTRALPIKWEDEAIDPRLFHLRFENDATYNKSYKIFIIENQFTDDWFLHLEDKTAIITTFEWESVYAPPSLPAYVCFLIAQSILCFAADLSEETAVKFAHRQPQGCVMDFCENKSDIKLGPVDKCVDP